MRMLNLKVPGRLAEAMEEFVEGGWFVDESEIVRQALSEFLQHRRLQLQEQFQRDDIRWACEVRFPANAPKSLQEFLLTGEDSDFKRNPDLGRDMLIRNR
jgi:Arc/MetJ-type ribon-helix-helix transcriptional regulator